MNHSLRSGSWQACVPTRCARVHGTPMHHSLRSGAWQASGMYAREQISVTSRASPREASCRAPAKRLAGPMTSDHLADNPITRRVREFAERVRQVQDRDLYLYLEPVEAIGGPPGAIAGPGGPLGCRSPFLACLGPPGTK